MPTFYPYMFVQEAKIENGRSELFGTRQTWIENTSNESTALRHSKHAIIFGVELLSGQSGFRGSSEPEVKFKIGQMRA